MNEEAMQLALSVSQGNPGAITVIRELMWFTKWESMMQWLLKEGHVGSKLWVLYKDKYKCDSMALGRWIEAKMQPKKSMKKSKIKYIF